MSRVIARRPRYAPGPGHHPTLDPQPGRSVSIGGAVAPAEQLRWAREPSLGQVRPTPWDVWTIQAVPASGTSVELIGPAGARQLGRVPVGYRCTIYSIAPYIGTATGPATSPFILGAGVALRWVVMFDGKAAPYYNDVTNLLGAWDWESEHSLLEVPEGTELRVQVAYTDPGGLYTHVGVRVRGQFIPWDLERAPNPTVERLP